MFSFLLEKVSRIWFVIFLILLVCVIIAIQLTAPTVKKELRLATGEVGSESYIYGMTYKSLLDEEGVKLTLVPTKGSLQTLEEIHQNKADIGFVHSGILQEDRKYNLQSLASVYTEPVWIFYRDDGYDINYIIETVGKNVGISSTNDGTLNLVKKIILSTGLENKISTILYKDNDALTNLKTKKIDFFITIASKQNDSIQELLKDENIKLMSVKRFQAFIQKYDFLTYINLFEGSIDLYRNIPSSDMNILSITQNLVSNVNVPNELIRIFLKKVKQIHGTIDLNKIDTLPNDEAKIYIENGESWLETIFPYWIASNIDRLKLFIIPLIWLIIPLFKSLIPLYIFKTRSKVFRWYSRLDKIKRRLKNKNEDIVKIRQDLEKLKLEIDDKTKVPLSYMGEYYNLIVHIELLETKIDKLS